MVANVMNDLMKLLQDGHARTIDMLAQELGTSRVDVERSIEFLENIGKIKRVVTLGPHCGNCSGCSSKGKGKACGSCVPDGGFKNMGEMWEVRR